MSDLERKQQLLKQAGYRYSPQRQLYYHRAERKAFSLEFIEDNTPAELERRIRENWAGPHWKFNFNTTPSESVKRQLETVLG